MWNTDITAAPRGEEKITTTIVDGKERTKREYHVAPVWLAFADGKVKRSYWVHEDKGFLARWSGCTAAETPIAWQHYVVPEHPFANTPQQQGKDGGEISAVKGKARLENATGVEPSPSIHFLEDCGSGA
ncbi:hypothetical protein [Agrobacterium larrymoorei]|uniref:hypothetical protein n=1 Tax=Agrobacterium larrymoorei TaxID=160699 RepID=UPI0030BD7027